MNVASPSELSSQITEPKPVNVQVRVLPSALVPENGTMNVRIIQSNSGTELIGRREAFQSAQLLEDVDEMDGKEFRRRLAETKPNELAVISFHRGVARSRKRLKQLSGDRTIVTLGGVSKSQNLTLIATDNQVIEQAKLSLASEDIKDGTRAGDVLHVFDNSHDAAAVRWAVFNCHDYTHADLIAELLRRKIELLVVVTYNNATQLYWEYATADVHRLFCYIVVVNVAEIGGSSVFAPFRRLGIDKHASVRAAGQIYSTRGPVETSAVVPLDIAELRRLRGRYALEGLSGPKDMGSESYSPLAPSEHFMHSFDRGAGTPPVKPVEAIQLDWNSDDPLVGVVQLDSIAVPVYLKHRYRLRASDGARPFESRVRDLLKDLEVKLGYRGSDGEKLDFLVFPEVFLPREFVKTTVASFATKTGTIVLCGVDYPGDSESENINTCQIVHPTKGVLSYDKITRSQYDAMATDGVNRMPMARGDRLYRFANVAGRTFGVLICYDFSHFDLIHQLNLQGVCHPLDVLFVIAHNPFGSLYRTCCVADSHRFYQHIVLCNVAEYGCSGVFAPIRADGARQTVMDLGMKNETIGLARLKLNSQRAAREAVDDDILNHREMMRRPGIFQRRIRLVE